MENIIKDLTQSSNFKTEIIFLKFQYPEIKDLLKHFLNLISASLVFSVTFSEKIIDFSNASFLPKSMLFGCWTVLILALGSCGLGIYFNYLAAELALDRISGNTHTPFNSFATKSYLFQDISGFLFGLGMALLVVTAVVKNLN